MSLMRERLKELSPELWQSLENSWKIALTDWLPKVDMGSKTDSSNSFPHLHNLEHQLDRVILGYEEYHNQRSSGRLLALSCAEIYVICASILFHDLGRIYQNRDEKDEHISLQRYIDELIKGIIRDPEQYKTLNSKSNDLPGKVTDKIEESNRKNVEEIIKHLDDLHVELKKRKVALSADIICNIKHLKDNPCLKKTCSSNDIERLKALIDEIASLQIAKTKKLLNIIKGLRRLLGKLNLLSAEQLRQLEGIIFHTIADSLAGHEGRLINTLIKSKLKKSVKIFIKEKIIKVSPQHGYYTRRVLIGENRYAELGIPSEMLAQAIAHVCEYHTNKKYPVPQTIAVNPYGKIRCGELAALLLLIDDMDDSSTRVYKEYINSINKDDDYKAVFRRKTGDVYLDPKRQAVFSVINDIKDIALRDSYRMVLRDKREHLERIKYPLAHLGIYIQGWQMEHDEKIITPVKGEQLYKESYEACFYQAYLDNVVDCMWSLSTQIFGAGSFSYEQLAVKVCEKDTQKIRYAVFRISTLSRAVVEEDAILKKMQDKIGIWTGSEEWQWLMYKDKEGLCRYVTPGQLKKKIEEGTEKDED